MSLLITSSFVDAVEWLETAPNSPCRDDPSMTWKEKAYKDLRGSLAREPWGEPDPVIVRGMQFEERVYDTLRAHADEKPGFQCSPEFQIFLDECRGGKFQQRLKRIEAIDGKEFCLFGKTDVSFPDKIIDIKTCSTYGGARKYLGKFQHLLYGYVSGVELFRYLIAEFGDVPNMKIQRVFPVDFTFDDKNALKENVLRRIRKAVGFVEQDEELWKLYTTTFSRY